jgi:hypothetical protein
MFSIHNLCTLFAIKQEEACEISNFRLLFFSDSLTLEDETDRLPQNVANQLPTYAA